MEIFYKPETFLEAKTLKPTFRSEPQGFFQHFRKWKSKTLKTCRDVLQRSPTSIVTIVYTHIFQRIPQSSEIIGSCHRACHDFCIRAKFGMQPRCHVHDNLMFKHLVKSRNFPVHLPILWPQNENEQTLEKNAKQSRE